MRRDHRRAAHGDCVIERLVGDVRDVDHDAQPVQLADDVLPEGRQAVVRRLVGRRIGPVVVLEMRERQIAHAAAGIITQLLQAVVDHVAAFHPHHRGDLVVGGGAADVRSGSREHEIAGMRPHGSFDRVDERVGARDRRRAGDRARDPDRKEQRVQSALAHPRDVDVAVRVAGLPMSNVLSEQQALRRVVVAVDDDRARRAAVLACGETAPRRIGSILA